MTMHQRRRFVNRTIRPRRTGRRL